MANNKAGGYISRIKFNNGEQIDIAANDIVVFVGPNNAGKSQSLKDIYTLSEKSVPGVVVSDISTTKYPSSIASVLSKISIGRNEGDYTSYTVLGHHMTFSKHTDKEFQDENYFGNFCKLFVADLDTSARLTICKPPQNIRRNESKKHPIHYAAFDGKYRKWLSQNFKKAFGIELTPNTQYGATIPLCIGEPIQLSNEYEDEQSRLEEYAKILETYKKFFMM